MDNIITNKDIQRIIKIFLEYFDKDNEDLRFKIGFEKLPILFHLQRPLTSQGEKIFIGYQKRFDKDANIIFTTIEFDDNLRNDITHYFTPNYVIHQTFCFLKNKLNLTQSLDILWEMYHKEYYGVFKELKNISLREQKEAIKNAIIKAKKEAEQEALIKEKLKLQKIIREIDDKLSLYEELN